MKSRQQIIASESPITVGISACLLGEKVRFNGGHTQSTFCRNSLSEYFAFRSFCPEVAAGFSTPRPTMRLVGDPQHPQLVFSKEGDEDLRTKLEQGFKNAVDNAHDLDGYIFMKNSPSCGMSRVKVYQPNGHPHATPGRGIFADALMKRFPSLPVEEEGRLNDPQLRENFILRVFAHARFRKGVLEQLSYKALLAFHSEYKYILMAHSQQAYRTLGKLLGQGIKKHDLHSFALDYFQQFMSAISTPANRKNHCNVLLHLLGYLKRVVDGNIRQDIVKQIDRYRCGEVQLATPLTLLSHYLNHYGNQYVQMQRYLEPYPAALGLSNRV